MQDPRSSSTLELVINEQQMQNMSRIDLRPSDANPQTTGQPSGAFSLEEFRRWPTRLREAAHAKLDEARAKSETKTQLALELVRVFSSAIVWALCFLFTIVMPVVLLLVGLVNLDDCPERPSLPYLIFAMGFVMTASNLFNLAVTLRLPVLVNQHVLTADARNIIASILNILFNCVVAFLYILSAYMLYSTSSVSQANGAEAAVDCNPTLYNFTYWFITLTLSISAVVVFLAIVLFCYNKYRLAIIRGSTPRSQAESSESNQTSTYSLNRV